MVKYYSYTFKSLFDRIYENSFVRKQTVPMREMANNSYFVKVAGHFKIKLSIKTNSVVKGQFCVTW